MHVFFMPEEDYRWGSMVEQYEADNEKEMTS